MLVDPDDCPLPSLDSTRLLARAALMEALKEDEYNRGRPYRSSSLSLVLGLVFVIAPPVCIPVPACTYVYNFTSECQ